MTIKEKHAQQRLKNVDIEILSLQKEVDQHKQAIRFLLSTNKQFQNEIQKEKIQKEQEAPAK